MSGRLRAPDLNGMAPHFSLVSLEGKRYTLDELKGQTVVINFWATWCGPCRFELPFLAHWAQSHPKVTVLGISEDRELETLHSFFKDRQMTYPIIWDQAHIREAYKVTTLPTTVVIGPDGQIVGAHTGVLFGPELDLILP